MFTIHVMSFSCVCVSFFYAENVIHFSGTLIFISDLPGFPSSVVVQWGNGIIFLSFVEGEVSEGRLISEISPPVYL